MARQKASPTIPEMVVDPELVELMFAEGARLGLDEAAIAALAGKKNPALGQGTVRRLQKRTLSPSLAWEIRHVLVEKGADIPPLVFGENDVARRWREVGELLRSLAPSEFKTELELHEERVARLLVRQESLTPSPSEMGEPSVARAWSGPETKPLRRDLPVDDRDVSYAGRSHGSEDQDTVAAPRKPTRNDRR